MMMEMKKKIILTVFIVFALLATCGCTSNTETGISVEDDDKVEETEAIEETDNFKWEYVSPEAENVDADAVDKIFSELDDEILSSVVVRNGKIIGEYFADGYDENSVFSLQSVSKSITGTLVGIAIDEGYIGSVDDYAKDYLSVLNEDKYKDKWGITIKELLNHTSGLISTDSSIWVDWRCSSDWITYLLDEPLQHEPGTYFEYSTGNTHILSAILEEVTGMSLMEYANKVLFKPLGITSATLDDVSKGTYVKDENSLIDSSSFCTDPSGVSDGGNGFSMSSLDMARIGLLYVNKGMWQDKQIVSGEYIDEATSIQAKRTSNGSCYGYCWWTNRIIGTNKYKGYFAQGYYGQFIFVVPDIELVVVFTSNKQSVSALDYQNLVGIIADGCN